MLAGWPLDLIFFINCFDFIEKNAVFVHYRPYIIPGFRHIMHHLETVVYCLIALFYFQKHLEVFQHFLLVLFDQHSHCRPLLDDSLDIFANGNQEA